MSVSVIYVLKLRQFVGIRLIVAKNAARYNIHRRYVPIWILSSILKGGKRYVEEH